MIRETVQALVACLITFTLCAVTYPAAVWGIGQLAFPRQAEGSLIERDGKILGSELIAQPFAQDKYFRPRPSAAGANGYAADAASGSNLGTNNPTLRQRIVLDTARLVASHNDDTNLKTLLDRLDGQQADLKSKNDIQEKTQADTDAIAKLEDQVKATQDQILDSLEKSGTKSLVPVDLVTTSGAGLDPHITPEGAYYQVARVATARNMPVAQVKDLIEKHIDRSGSLIGAPARVNVLRLNLALDEEKPASVSETPVDRKAGTPTSAEIDAAFSGLTKANGRDWLAFNRQRISR